MNKDWKLNVSSAWKNLHLHRLLRSFVKIGLGLGSLHFFISKAIKYDSDEKSIFPAAPGFPEASHWSAARHMTKLGD